MNVVASLRDRKAQLVSDIAELKAQASQLWSSHSFEYDGNEDGEAISPCSFWPAPEGNWTAGNWTTVQDNYSKFGSTVVSLPCGCCGSNDGFVQHELRAGNMTYVSACCLVCGWLSSSGVFYLAPLAVPIITLAQILTALSRCEGLLRLVTIAVKVLLARLKSAASNARFATRQRKFFTYHGAHPPRIQPRRAVGLLSGRAFQLHLAT
jgi:hypothetical protein